MKMDAHVSPAPYDSFTSFYRDVYTSAIREVRTAGRSGASLFVVEQEAGDWSDAPVPDIVIAQVIGRPYSGVLDLGGGLRSARAQAGAFGVTPPGYATTIKADVSHALRMFSIRYSSLLALTGDDSALPPDGDFGPAHSALLIDREIAHLLERLWAEGRDGSPHGALWADGAILQIASVLLRLRNGSRPEARGGLSPRQLKQVLDYLEAHVADDIALQDLAGIAGVSPGHFCRAFKQSMGLSCTQQLIALRMDRAKQMLRNSALPVIEVAAACGYDSPSRFAMLFKRETGHTPTAWRRAT
jgi:AraC family transcriptional regulator